MYTRALKGFSRKLKTVYQLLLGWLRARYSSLSILYSSFISSTKSMLHKEVPKFLGIKNRRVLLVSIVVACVLSGLSIIVWSPWTAITLGSRGNIKVNGVGVYKDANCNIAVEYLDWGTLEPGSAQNITLYIRNEGNHVATLFLATDNWNPANASNYMVLSWNYYGKMLSPMETVEAILTLSVSSNVENIVNFSFNVIIGINE